MRSREPSTPLAWRGGALVAYTGELDPHLGFRVLMNRMLVLSSWSGSRYELLDVRFRSRTSLDLNESVFVKS
jgi:hypothetical protein